MRFHPILLTTLLCSLVPLAAQDTKPAPAKLRVHIIGASVSGGFCDGPLFGAKEQGDSVTLQVVLKKWAGEQARATTHSTTDMTQMFMDPPRIGKAQIDGVAKAKPDLVVGIDFPFWFAYGRAGGDEAEARKAKLAEGLALLEKLEMPVLLGDLPDMKGAAKRMLQPSWIPSPEVLKQLNEQLAAFVAAHENMHLVPLSAFVTKMKGNDATLPLAGGPLAIAPGALLQEDRLHATRLGMALLGHSLQDPLRALFPKDHPLREQKWKFEQFVEAVGAEAELQTLQEAAKKEAAKKEPAGAGAGTKGG
ncbi:MAG TPA: hypothetical protein VF384_12415 [Planctomycetota bacterium]